MFVAAAAIAAVLAAPADARRGRDRDQASAPDTTATAPAPDTAPARTLPVPEQPSGTVPVTFLDTVNRGREARLTENDFALPQQAGPAAPRERKTADSAANMPAPAAHPSRQPPPSRDVFRIQCMAATQSDGLDAARNALRTKVPYPVLVMHSPPYYKLLVGEFATRAEAERALFDVRGCGYPDAWIVRGIAGQDQ